MLNHDIQAEVLGSFRKETDLRLLRLLLAIKEPTVDAFAERLLIDAVYAEDCLVRLLEYGAGVNAPPVEKYGKTALQAAAETGDIELVRILLDTGADVHAQPASVCGVTALQVASIHTFVGIVKLLLEHNADVNAPATANDGRTALEGAAEHGRLLLNGGVERNVRVNDQCRRAVEFASSNGHHAVARFLQLCGDDGFEH